MRNAFVVLLLAVPVLAVADDVPENLDRAAISDGVAKIKPKLMACGQNSNASGTVKLNVIVARMGRYRTSRCARRRIKRLANVQRRQ